MTEQTILFILLAIITFDFALERTLSFLNNRNAKKPIPAELEGIYDEEKYKKLISRLAKEPERRKGKDLVSIITKQELMSIDDLALQEKLEMQSRKNSTNTLLFQLSEKSNE